MAILLRAERASWFTAGTLAAALACFMVLNAPQAFATHVRCGDVITQNTKLDSDLNSCPGDGIVIGADHITLDLHGHVIDGDGVGRYEGIGNTTGHDAVTVKGPGRIQGFTWGVLLVNATDNVIRGLEAFDASRGISVEGGAATGNVVAQNRVFGNDATGISVINDYGQNRVQKNTVWANGFGIFLSGNGDGNLIERNRLSANEIGIFLIDSFGDALVARNNVSRNCSGIDLLETQHAQIERNKVVGSGGDCPFVSRADGIHIGGSSSRNVVERNVASENADDGIDMADPGSTVTRNKADKNGDLGIEAVTGTIDGGGNKAKRNGNPAECTNVACK
jgi:parallel beta-helix repeat protein